MNSPMSHEASARDTGRLVKKSIFVNAAPERAFAVFTTGMGTWWPLATHKIGKAAAADAIVEPFAGGRWYERGEDGVECDWGRVLVWEPPSRLVLGWELDADWKSDATLQTEVSVTFTQERTGTRVDLEHRLLERYGDRAAEMQKTFDSPGAWAGMLAAFAQRCAAPSEGN